MASDSLPTPPSVTPTPAAAASGSQSTDAPSPAAGLLVPPATAAAGVQHAPTQAETLESLLQQIVASSNPSALAGTLRNAVGTPEAREEVLASTMSAGADPLEALDAAQHTIGALFILYVVDLAFSLPLPPQLRPPFRHTSFVRICPTCYSPAGGAALSWILNGDSGGLIIETNGLFPSRSARLTSASTSAPAIPFAYIGNFCQHFDPEQARLAPERGALRESSLAVYFRF
jgi:hypothetical protein